MKKLDGKGHRLYENHGGVIDFKDDKIAFFVKYCKGKDVLDIGCVQHDPENYLNKHWLYGALNQVANSCVGLDYLEEGVKYLVQKGFNMELGNAEDFDLGKKFDVITAGDLIEHLGNISNFLQSCKNHMKNDSLLLLSFPHPWHWRTVAKALFTYDVKPNKEHTCWLCVGTFTNFVARHDMEIVEIRGGMRTALTYPLLDKFVPLATLRNNSILAAVKLKS
ncbi:MAG: methyltransferase domain-containing protein [Deltaproteobacteria bacterium]|nr:methyltransferase domain-containing protein [Deltaproteobacteria bacterium]